jgi:hypothetical protein
MVAGLVALWASRFVQGRTGDAYQTGSRALSLADPGSKLSSQAHHAVGGSAVSLGRPAEGLLHLELAADLGGSAIWLITSIRADIHSRAWAAHAHWLLGHDTEALSGCHQASSWPGRSTTRSAWPWRWPMAVSLTRCAMTCPR